MTRGIADLGTSIGVALLLAVGACSASSPAPDTLAADVMSPDQATVDWRPPDFPPRPDTLPGHVVCGGTRRLRPTLDPVSEPTACGKGCRQVTFTGEVGPAFEVKGQILVYTSGATLLRDVHYVDLESGRSFLVRKKHLESGSGRGRGCHHVSTDGQQIAYTCIQQAGGERLMISISTYDLATSTEKDHLCNHTFSTTCPPSGIALGSEGFAVNMSYASCYDRVYYQRYTDSSQTLLSTAFTGFSVDHSGTRVVWDEDPPAAHQRVMVYDLVAKQAKPVAPGSWHQYRARIDDDRVIWTDSRNGPQDRTTYFGNSDIFYRNLPSGPVTAVSTNPATQVYPDIEGDWAVWTDLRHEGRPVPGYILDGGDVYAKNLATGKEHRLTNFYRGELYPKIADKKVYFRADSKQGKDIYVIDLKTRLGL